MLCVGNVSNKEKFVNLCFKKKENLEIWKNEEVLVAADYDRGLPG